MFIGHYAVALAAKKAAPQTSLGTFVLAAQFLDLLWPLFLLADIEHVRIAPGNTAFTPLDFYDYPYSHSLFAVLIWALGLGGIYYFFRKEIKGAMLLGACVLSHWLLDAVTHRPDLPLLPGGKTLVGFRLWNYFIASAVVELIIFSIAIMWYVRATTAIDRTGRYAFHALIAFLSLIWIMNMLGPPPPNVNAIAIAGLSLWLIVPWAYWIDRHRQNTVSE